MSEAEYSERLQALEDEIASLRDTNAVLMESVEASLDSSGGALAMLQRSILLEKLIEERTRDTELSNRLLRQEVSDRVKAERRFLLFKSAVEHAAEGMVITDTEGVVEYANPAFLAITGYGLNEIMGAPLSAFRSVNYSDDFYEEIWNTLRRGDVWKGNLQSRRADGSLLDEEDTMSPVRDVNGAVINFVILVRDVTKEKSLEAQLRQAQKLESIGQLAAGIAHEINTPTQYISDNTRFLKDSIGDLVELIGHYQKLAQSVQDESSCCDAMRAADEHAQKIDLPYLVEEIPKSIDQCLEGLGRVAGIVKAMKEFSHPGTSGLVPTDLNKAISSTITV